MDQQLEKPHPPADNDCCGGGSCCPCVWDAYYEALRLWRQQQGQEEPQQAADQRPTEDPDTFYR